MKEHKFCKQCSKKFYRDEQGQASWNAKQCCSKLCVQILYEQRKKVEKERKRDEMEFQRLRNWKNPIDVWLYKYRPIA